MMQYGESFGRANFEAYAIEAHAIYRTLITIHYHWIFLLQSFAQQTSCGAGGEIDFNSCPTNCIVRLLIVCFIN